MNKTPNQDCEHATKLTGQCVKCGQYPYDTTMNQNTKAGMNSKKSGDGRAYCDHEGCVSTGARIGKDGKQYCRIHRTTMNKNTKAVNEAFDAVFNGIRNSVPAQVASMTDTTMNKNTNTPKEHTLDECQDMKCGCREYELTDGKEVFARKHMTEAEAREANETSLRHTAGKIEWK